METNKPFLIIANQLSKADVEKIQHFQKTYKHFKFYLAYLMPIIPAHFYRIPSMCDINQTFYQESKNTLAEISQRTQINPAHCFLVKGGAASAFELAKQLKVQGILTSCPFKFKLLHFLGMNYQIPCIKLQNFHSYLQKLDEKMEVSMQMRIRGV